MPGTCRFVCSVFHRVFLTLRSASQSRFLSHPTSAQAHPPSLYANSVIFCEAVAIYGVIVSIILQTKIEKSDEAVTDLVGTKIVQQYAAYSVFWAGVCCGLGNLACGCASPPLKTHTPRITIVLSFLPLLQRSAPAIAIITPLLLDPRPPHLPILPKQGVRRHLWERLCAGRRAEWCALCQDLGHRDLRFCTRHLRHHRRHHRFDPGPFRPVSYASRPWARCSQGDAVAGLSFDRARIAFVWPPSVIRLGFPLGS